MASFNTLPGQEALVAHFNIDVDGALKTDEILPNVRDTLTVKGNLPTDKMNIGMNLYVQRDLNIGNSMNSQVRVESSIESYWKSGKAVNLNA